MTNLDSLARRKSSRREVQPTSVDRPQEAHLRGPDLISRPLPSTAWPEPFACEFTRDRPEKRWDLGREPGRQLRSSSRLRRRPSESGKAMSCEVLRAMESRGWVRELATKSAIATYAICYHFLNLSSMAAVAVAVVVVITEMLSTAVTATAADAKTTRQC